VPDVEELDVVVLAEERRCRTREVVIRQREVLKSREKCCGAKMDSGNALNNNPKRIKLSPNDAQARRAATVDLIVNNAICRHCKEMGRFAARCPCRGRAT
jgi:hypothetical protein